VTAAGEDPVLKRFMDSSFSTMRHLNKQRPTSTLRHSTRLFLLATTGPGGAELRKLSSWKLLVSTNRQPCLYMQTVNLGLNLTPHYIYYALVRGYETINSLTSRLNCVVKYKKIASHQYSIVYRRQSMLLGVVLDTSLGKAFLSVEAWRIERYSNEHAFVSMRWIDENEYL
jgi:hypothetical protein